MYLTIAAAQILSSNVFLHSMQLLILHFQFPNIFEENISFALGSGPAANASEPQDLTLFNFLRSL